MKNLVITSLVITQTVAGLARPLVHSDDTYRETKKTRNVDPIPTLPKTVKNL